MTYGRHSYSFGRFCPSDMRHGQVEMAFKLLIGEMYLVKADYKRAKTSGAPLRHPIVQRSTKRGG
jgi:hypothetical protein